MSSRSSAMRSTRWPTNSKRGCEELEEERARLGSATERIGATLAATHDPDQLLGVVLETTREAAGATSAVLANERGELLQVGQPDPSRRASRATARRGEDQLRDAHPLGADSSATSSAGSRSRSLRKR